MTDFGVSAFVAAWVIVHGGSGTPAQAQPMTMDEAIVIAQRNAFGVRLQKTTVEKDRQAMLLALANLGPTAGVSAILTRFGNLVAVKFSPTSAPLVVSPISTETGTATLTLPIDISGNLHRLLGASDASLASAKRTLEATFNDARLNARSAFLSVLRTKALVTVADETLKDAQGRLDQANLFFAQQRIAKVDVDRLDAQVAQDTSDLLTAKNNQQLAEYAFNLALAQPIETPVNLAELNDLPAIPANSDSISKAAQQNRPESQSLVEQIKALALIRRATEQGMNPTLALGAGYQVNFDPQGFGSQGATKSLSMTFTVPLFDSGATRARVREARQDEETAKIQLEQEQLSISQEVRNAFANLGSAQARLTNGQRQVTLAEEVFRLSKVRQDAGEGTYVEVVDAESALAAARNGLVSARYDYLLAYSQLQRAVGNDRIEATASVGSKKDAGGTK